MSVEGNKELVRRWFEDGYNKGNLSVMDEVLATEVTSRTHALEVHESTSTPDDDKEFQKSVAVAFPDFQFTVDEMLGEGDTVAVQYTFVGTHKAKFGDSEPTNKKGKMTLTALMRIVDGKIAEIDRPSGWGRYIGAMLDGSLFEG